MRIRPKAREVSKNLSLGFNVKQSFIDHPEIADAWILYDQCREQELVKIEKTKGAGKSQVTEVNLIPRTTGYKQLPWVGGMLDQPWRIMIFFDAFQAGESDAWTAKVR